MNNMAGSLNLTCWSLMGYGLQEYLDVSESMVDIDVLKRQIKWW